MELVSAIILSIITRGYGISPPSPCALTCYIHARSDGSDALVQVRKKSRLHRRSNISSDYAKIGSSVLSVRDCQITFQRSPNQDAEWSNYYLQIKTTKGAEFDLTFPDKFIDQIQPGVAGSTKTVACDVDLLSGYNPDENGNAVPSCSFYVNAAAVGFVGHCDSGHFTFKRAAEGSPIYISGWGAADTQSVDLKLHITWPYRSDATHSSATDQQARTPNLSGKWIADASHSIEIHQTGATIRASNRGGGYTQSLSGKWNPSDGWFDYTVRRTNPQGLTTLMQGHMQLQGDTLVTDITSTDGNGDLPADFKEHLEWHRE